ncbi:hypothetical protein PO587_38820 [Streptomyces gilvifuscus]|uniref:Uncharacterized protein n=1 Tax=Streptomyces gilvifuscus TaxID=1550617 RepID=A0ABT5G695_9ACTN|nr:hypothetical protein [Streptomyces gilvifuscus]MDC2960396.1 hypothetical protein [Streptomyces gilvifuscus]
MSLLLAASYVALLWWLLNWGPASTDSGLRAGALAKGWLPLSLILAEVTQSALELGIEQPDAEGGAAAGPGRHAARRGLRGRWARPYFEIVPSDHPGVQAPLGWTLSHTARDDLDRQLSAIVCGKPWTPDTYAVWTNLTAWFPNASRPSAS